MKTKLEIKDKAAPTEGIKVAVFKKNIRKTSAHKHNSYFEIIYMTKGSGTHTTDTQEVAIEPPIVFTIRKEQLHFWDIQSEPEGYVLIIKKQFIDNCMDQELKRLISKLTEFSSMQPKDAAVGALFEMLTAEYEKEKLSNRPIVDGLMKALLGKLLQSAPVEPFATNKNDNHFVQFKELLVSQEKPANSVAHYAGLLHTTPQNLNAICRKEVGQSAAAVLSDYIITEAKRMLLYTDHSINEIAYLLNFKDNSHFTKYFKRHTGQTPKTLRKTN